MVLPSQGSTTEAGPRAELEFWRGRAQSLARLIERLKAQDARLVIGIAGAARSKAYKQWKELEPKVSHFPIHSTSK